MVLIKRFIVFTCGVFSKASQFTNWDEKNVFEHEMVSKGACLLYIKEMNHFMTALEKTQCQSVNNEIFKANLQ